MLRNQISSALSTFFSLSISQAALAFWQTLGYHSDLRLEGLPTDATGFAREFGIADTFRPDKAFATSWRSVHFLFQVTGEEVTAQNSLFQGGLDKARSDSYLFFAVELVDASYSRGTLVQITRELNRPFQSPILVLFKYGQKLTLAIVDRRANKREAGRDVLEKVTLIKDINLADPHAAHLRILEELELPKLRATNWDELHAAWRKVLDLSELNKKFYRELSDWFFWARTVARFPAATTEKERSVAVIRLITRTMFAYFIKERGLVPKVFFEPDQFSSLLKDTTPRVSTYYNGILQNLFFAALNAEPSARGWQDEIQENEGNESGYSDTYLDSSKRRYRELFVNSEAARGLFDSVPFLNGGLFECLDTRNTKTRIETRHDGFSSKEPKRAFVPNYLFWGDEHTVDLNSIYQTKSRSYSVRPLLEILNRYKFTVAENTPLEEEVALDPELLGKVFENLLASYNPETETTARKQTGSFYTPREIVDYMVEESVLAYLEGAVTGDGAPDKDVLRALVSYDTDVPKLSLEQRQALIKAVGSVTILDPACGSGAFPMGCLHRLTWILGRLDQGGALWKAEQQRQISSLDMPEAREAAQARFDEAVSRDGGDYVRKLYLIERCLFGVDIQPIAVQISKLRFFISLIVDQQLDPKDPAKDVQPLPNLETKFVAANTLLRPNAGQQVFKSAAAYTLEEQLFEVRRRHFSARKWSDKRKFREEDERLRAELAEELILTGMPEGDAHKMAEWNPYDQSQFAPFFDVEWMFGPSLKEGFDVMIGNPPYVFARNSTSKGFTEEEKRYYYANYELSEYQINLYPLFIEAGDKLLHKRGILSYITPNNWMTINTNKKLRQFILSKTDIILVNFLKRVFESADVDSSVIIYRRHGGETHLRLFEYENGLEIIKEAEIGYFLSNNDAIINIQSFKNVGTVNIVQKIESRSRPLSFYSSIKSGLKAYETGKGFPPQTQEMKNSRIYHSRIKKSDSIKYLDGKDVCRYYLSWSGEYLEYGDNLAAPRGDFRLFSSPRILVRQIPAPLPYCLHACYTDQIILNDLNSMNIINIQIDPLYILGVLNSRAISYWFAHKFGKLQRGIFPQFKVNELATFPIPIASSASQSEISNIVDHILKNKQANSKVDTKDLENEVDKLVYKLYDLDDESIALIEGVILVPIEEE